MAALPPSGKSLPASIAAVYFEIMADVLGRNGAEAVVRHAGLDSWLPAPSSEGVVDFSALSAMLASLEDTIGERGARGLMRRMGGAAFDRLIRPAGPVTAMQDPTFQTLPDERKLQAGLHTVARVLSQLGDWRADTEDVAGGALLRSVPCPHCWGRTSTEPLCAATIGLLSSAVRWIGAGDDPSIEETSCIASGGGACEIVIRLGDAS
jgi:hypothetical protein